MDGRELRIGITGCVLAAERYHAERLVQSPQPVVRAIQNNQPAARCRRDIERNEWHVGWPEELTRLATAVQVEHEEPGRLECADDEVVQRRHGEPLKIEWTRGRVRRHRSERATSPRAAGGITGVVER